MIPNKNHFLFGPISNLHREKEPHVCMTEFLDIGHPLIIDGGSGDNGNGGERT